DLTTPDAKAGSDGKLQISMLGMPVLGLAASTKYDFVVEAMVDGKTVKSPPVSFTTGALPMQLANVTLDVTPTKGKPSTTGYYLVEGTGPFAFAVDGEGTVRWYREFGNFAAEAKMQYDGTFTTFVGNTMGFEALAGQYEAVTPDTSETGNPTVFTDNHDLLVSKDAKGQEHIHLIGYEMRPVSSTDSTIAAWHVIQRESPDGTLEFQWKTWSRFTSADAVDPLPGAMSKDLDHMNALSFDP